MIHIPLTDKLINSNIAHMEFDQNDRYVLKNCIGYLRNHLVRYPSLGKETTRIVLWILGKDTDQIDKFVISNYDADQQQDVYNELIDNSEDLDDYAAVIVRALRQKSAKVKKAYLKLILSLLEKRNRSLSDRTMSDTEKNITTIAKMFSLTRHEKNFIAFLYIVTCYDAAKDFFIHYLECCQIAGEKYLFNLLGITKKEIYDVLNGTLKNIAFFYQSGMSFEIEDNFVKLFQSPKDNVHSENFYLKIPGDNIPLDFHFISKKVKNHLLRIFKNKPKSSTHLLLYGPPGTGKTSFAQSLINQLAVPGYDIVRGEDNKSQNRRAAILACLNLTNNGKGSIVMVDEADNLLNTQHSFFDRGETQDKGWLNQLLEQPRVRTIWITNSIDEIDSSVLRRFAYSIHFKPFNRRQRIQLWHNILARNTAGRFLQQTEIENFAIKYKANAGIVDLAVKKAVESCRRSKGIFKESIELALEAHQTLENSGQKTINKDRVNKIYSLEGLNVNGDLDETLFQLKKFDQYLRRSNADEMTNTNLLFYGPPGTGKSELARHIADRLDREIICKRASDLQNMFVGETEKNIRDAFIEAETEEAILIIDEADSILFNRDRAMRSWETSFTNEFLTQMERFRGILICTTNRLTDLDDASIRRFNHKIRFDYLKQDGNVIFYQKLLADLISAPVSAKILNQLRKIEDLSPGDFKTVREKFKFHSQKELNHQMLLQVLSEEANIKNSHKMKRAIGF